MRVSYAYDPGASSPNPYLNALLWGTAWNTTASNGEAAGIITYSIDDGTWNAAFTGLEAAAINSAVQCYENICNVDFVQVQSHNPNDPIFYENIAFVKVTPRYFAFTGYDWNSLGVGEAPMTGSMLANDPNLSGVFINNFEGSGFSDTGLVQGGFGYVTLIHEFGHALGLAHPHDNGGTSSLFPGVTDAFGDFGDYNLNQGIFTTMSYNDGWQTQFGRNASLEYGYQGAPMAFDIAALQQLYGANISYKTGSDTYVLPTENKSGTFFSCIWDAGGVDTISNQGASVSCTINLTAAPLTGANAGGYVSWNSSIMGGYTIAHGVTVENAIGGTGNDSIIGNSSDNILDGGSGNDTLIGGSGNDTYIIDGSDTITEDTDEGTDTVLSSVTYILASNLENLTLTGSSSINGTGNSLNNMIIGNGASNRLNGGAGGDTLDGGVGIDTLIGGTGDDTYFTDGSDELTEVANGGTDTVKSSVSNTLWSAFIENLTLTGSADIAGSGNSLDNIITGNIGKNSLFGNLGNDTLDGGGGNDTLVGGDGNDTYITDGGDWITGEGADQGTDTVQSSVSYTLGTNLAVIENLTLIGVGSINGTGDALNNVITGNGAANSLDGGTGTDTLYGGLGDDTYITDGGDFIGEGVNEGNDRVWSYVSYSLGTNIETLKLLGNAAIGNGNELNNLIFGNDYNNTLDGTKGADTLSGYYGDDTYVTDGGDLIYEDAFGGTDTVQSSVNYILADNLENLTLTASSAINGTGNAANNVINGNSSNNILDGTTGADTLIGGLGDDTYITDGGDAITEGASAGTDTVQSSASISLSDNIENLTLGGYSAINGTGNSGNNVITGNGSNNILDGTTGNDTLIGGLGNDTYVTDGGDTITEAASAGTDTIQSSITYTLATNLENLILTGSSAINGTGNSSNNTINGNNGNNVLDGNTGNDTLIGGSGDDTYVTDGNDTITEAASAGTDTVQSSVTHTLGTNLENLTLTGSSAISGTGNSGNNNIIGNSAANTLNGGDGADTLNGLTGTDSLVGGTGDDTYVTDGGDTITESASAGTDTVQSSLTYTLATNLENLTLTGSAAINGTGNSVNNIITGNSAGNTLNGSTGSDTLIGGSGDDIYVTDGGDTITENAAEGTDTVQSSVTYTLGSNLENLTLTGSSAINGTGNSSNNTINGNSGANILDGGTGTDTLIGGAGNDTYIIDGGDTITEAASAGTDIVQSSATFTLGANLENLTLTGSSAINGKGNSLNNSITGNSGNNVLDGNTGTDTLTGGTGDDTYITDGNDTITEAASAGTDTVQSSVTYTLGTNLENLSLTGTSAINGTGNKLNNVITGNSGNNTLSGGTGTDTLIGGLGNDTYITDGGDMITEAASAGTDAVQSSASFTLGENLENLTLTGSSATNGTGNSGNNTITGNSGNNILDGGTGADTLIGGAGNDTYVTDGGDTITEATSAGTDTVQSSVTYTLATNLENLTLTGSVAINGTGNTLNNVITGNSATNTLDGGTGTDTLIGGLGNDTFIFKTVAESATTATTSDVISDFVRGQDKINLSTIDAFASSGANDTFLWKGTAAFSSTTQGEVRYQKFDNTGSTNDYTMVWIDNDADTAVEMAIRLTGLHTLTASDFIL
jgi:Ca2+-binding RTX toxin-like protein